jgi:hypothetical protein
MSQWRTVRHHNWEDRATSPQSEYCGLCLWYRQKERIEMYEIQMEQEGYQREQVD